MSNRTQDRPDLRTTLNLPRAIHTNSTLIAGLPDEFDNNLRQRRYAEAKARQAGVSPTGKRFVYQLCPKGEPYSPKAWVDESDYKDQCKRKAIKQGKELIAGNGTRTLVKAPVDKPAPFELPYQVNDAVVRKAVQTEIIGMRERGEPVPTPKQRTELGEKLREKHSGN